MRSLAHRSNVISMRGLALAIAFATACSWVYLHMPTAPRAAEPIACDPDSPWPYVDGAIAIASTTAMLTGLVGVFYAEPRDEVAIPAAGS